MRGSHTKNSGKIVLGRNNSVEEGPEQELNNSQLCWDILGEGKVGGKREGLLVWEHPWPLSHIVSKNETTHKGQWRNRESPDDMV